MFFLKRLANAFVTIPLLAIVSVALIYFSAFIGHWLDVFEKSSTQGFLEIIILFGGALIFCAIGLGAVLVGTLIPLVLMTGDGIFWRRVYKDDFLQDKSGKTIHTFNKDSLIWRFDPIFQKRKLLCYDF